MILLLLIRSYTLFLLPTTIVFVYNYQDNLEDWSDLSSLKFGDKHKIEKLASL